MVLMHMNDPPRPRRELYRIFVHDRPPLSNKARYPVSNRAVDFSKSSTAILRNDFHQKLRSKRKVALRPGELGGGGRG